jgi:hypothetical protein
MGTLKSAIDFRCHLLACDCERNGGKVQYDEGNFPQELSKPGTTRRG